MLLSVKLLKFLRLLMIGISSCLAGIKCTYKGSDNLIEQVKQLAKRDDVVLICPEVLGGLTIPRTPCEIIADQVMDINGVNKSEAYQLGAKRALKILQENNVDVVLLKAKSPSCGKGYVYDGTFSHHLIKGNGIACKLFQKHGIMVYNENELDEFFKFIEKR